MPAAWRLTKTKLLAGAFSGAGARKHGGRWNSPGTSVIYVSSNLSLAALEILVHVRRPALLAAYSSMRIEFPDRIVEKLDRTSLPADWRRFPAPPELRAIGDSWVAQGRSAILEVPSAIVETEANFLLNPAHVDFAKVSFGAPIAFAFDARLS